MHTENYKLWFWCDTVYEEEGDTTWRMAWFWPPILSQWVSLHSHA